MWLPSVTSWAIWSRNTAYFVKQPDTDNNCDSECQDPKQDYADDPEYDFQTIKYYLHA
jgi:hypothetical protein